MNDHRDHERPFSADSSKKVLDDCRQLLVRRERSFGVRQHFPSDRNDPVLSCESSELLPGRGGIGRVTDDRGVG